MLKLLGGALIVAASAGVGHVAAGRLQYRCRLLFGLQQGLLSWSNQIAYADLPLSRAMAGAAAAAGAAAPLFRAAAQALALGQGRTAGDIWRDCLADWPGGLQEKDRQILLALGPQLGLTGRQEQLQMLELTRLALAGQEQEAAAYAGSFCRVWRCLSWGCGLVTALLLL
ncbi:MAG: stage III sporulation protein AB [Firmicutes bacterium]|nr:stage III sporulation protein AB [Bacillota bacterium]